MQIGKNVASFSMAHYRLLAVLAVLITIVTAALIPMIKVDTDPENMLSKDEAVRVFHRQTEETFDLSDIVVLGIINETHPDGVFNVQSLNKIYELTEYAKTLTWHRHEEDRRGGVIAVDIMAPSTVDHIEQGDMPGVVNFEWLMPNPVNTAEEALRVRDRFLSNPIFKNTLISEDGQALCVYIPITSKDYSYNVYRALRDRIAEYEGDEKYHITGLPVAQDTFGVEMFVQMAISAPMAMFIIFLLMLSFFRKLILIILPLIIAMISVIFTMGVMIGLGFPVHIMSSMIPIFLMPIAVVDSVHILSEFFDVYSEKKGRKAAISEVMEDLFAPMLYTSLTSAAGFASLALTPIPPVQVFGIFVALGIMVAWFSTILLTPAYIMFIKESSLAGFGHNALHQEKASWLTELLHSAGRFTYKNAKIMVAAAIIVVVVAIYGITKIEINDNPVKWFSKNHPIRQADIELNKHFGGTYMAYLVLEADEHNVDDEYLAQIDDIVSRALKEIEDDFTDTSEAADKVLEIANRLGADYKGKPVPEFLKAVAADILELSDAADDMEQSDILYEISLYFELEKENSRVFKQPEMLRYISDFQRYLAEKGIVGKTNSVADIVKKVHQELIDGKPESYRIPDTVSGVSQCLIQYQSSHRPQDLWRFATYDFMMANIWFQLISGDNKDMEAVVEAVDNYFAANTPPEQITHKWAGMTYINTVWQDKMVWGMLQSFLGSFIIVFIMMSVLFRSPLWGIICMLPLTVTIVVIYGVIGFVGKDYDMPVAVLSALTLGMAVDFAIHFLSRAKASYAVTGSWEKSSEIMFGEPARAIARNVLVIAIGFLPLLAAPLVPYKTVGVLLCAIMALSGTVTLLILPPVIKIAQKRLFREDAEKVSMKCSCGFCIIVSIAAVVLIAVNIARYWDKGITALTVYSAVAIIVMSALCAAMSKRKVCKTNTNNTENERGEK